MAVVAYAATGFAALANVGDPWYGRVLDDTYYMVTVFLLAVATILAVIRRGRSQSVWLGFAVFGWVHLLFGWPDSGGSPARAGVVTSARVAGTYRPRFPHMTLAGWAIPDPTTAAGASNPLKLDYTWHVLQTTVTMATALLGALVGNFLWKPVEQSEGGSREGSTGDGDSPGGASL
jgi:hypothetical protein